MTQKQLANVLVKILGLSFLPDAIMHFISGLAALGSYWALESSGRAGLGSSMPTSVIWTNCVSGVLLALVGIAMIVGSRKITGWLFVGESE